MTSANEASTHAVADVRVSHGLDRLVIAPRSPASAHHVGRALRQALPGVAIRRFAAGFWLYASDAGPLLEQCALRELRWSDEARRVAQNRRWVRDRRDRFLDDLFRIKKGGVRVAKTLLQGATGLEALDDHQWVNVAAMTLPNSYGLCVFDEQGAGKTVTLIHAFDVLVDHDEVDFALIIAPKSMIAEWPRDFSRFKHDLYKVVVATGTRSEKRKALFGGADVIVTNFESAASMEQELGALLRAHSGRAMLVVDESFYVKNLDAKRTSAVRRLREFCSRAFVLCGTPAPNSPHDVIQQVNIVDFGITFGGVDVPDNRDTARAVVQDILGKKGPFVRHLKREVLPDLHPKRFNRVFVQMEPQQEKLYEAALQSLISDLRSANQQEFRRNITSFLARRNALLQICSNPEGVAMSYNETPAKLQALDDLLGNLIRYDREKVVVWSFYTASLSAIFARYECFNPVRYDGSVSDVAIRREAVRRFQEDDKTMLFVGNPAAAGAGLTLHRARFAVYESMSNQAAHYLQSLDRIHRRGQTRSVEYIVLLCQDSIEVTEYEKLTQKESDAQHLLGDVVEQPMTRDAMLAELLQANALRRPQFPGREAL